MWWFWLFSLLLFNSLILGKSDNTLFAQFLVAPSTKKGGSISFAGCLQLLGFCAFEACVGIFWPSIMKMRSQYIPEESRSTIMNFFRIPLNIFVCIVLYNVSTLSLSLSLLRFHFQLGLFMEPCWLRLNLLPSGLAYVRFKLNSNMILCSTRLE